MDLKNATVVIADDEAILLEIYTEWLEREGCRVLTAQNGSLALDLIKGTHVDLVVSDIRMPVMDGLSLVRHVREGHSDIPKMIFVTGYADVDNRECYGLGVEAKIQKPMRRQEFVSVMKRCLKDRNELWQQPDEREPTNVLTSTFDSLSSAIEQGLVGFGRGGFCIHTKLEAKEDENVGIGLKFGGDPASFSGQGIIRWVARHEQLVGVEISYVRDADRTWVVEVARQNVTNSFIPRASQPRIGES